jgi:hypothetical protein
MDEGDAPPADLTAAERAATVLTGTCIHPYNGGDCGIAGGPHRRAARPLGTVCGRTPRDCLSPGRVWHRPIITLLSTRCGLLEGIVRHPEQRRQQAHRTPAHRRLHPPAVPARPLCYLIAGITAHWSDDPTPVLPPSCLRRERIPAILRTRLFSIRGVPL